MKKALLIGLLGLLSINIATAQNKFKKPDDFVSVKAGSWGLGYQATFLHHNDISFQSGLFAKYFVADNWSLRGNLRFGRDWAKGPAPEYLTDGELNGVPAEGEENYEADDKSSSTIRKSNFMIIVGAEHRHKLSNRIFGYYGVDLGIGGYGQIVRARNMYGQVYAISKQNRSTDISLQPFIGIEFFLGSQISLSLEAGYDVLFKFYAKDKYNEIDINDKEQEFFQYNKIASHVDFGNVVFGTAKFSFYF